MSFIVALVDRLTTRTLRGDMPSLATAEYARRLQLH